LLGAGVVILENVALTGVDPGAYKLICLPLRVRCDDGAPVRAVLIAERSIS
jgi:arylformamidase